MAKKTRKGFRNPNATSGNLAPRPAKVSDMMTGIAQLMLQGSFPGTHSKLVVAAINSLEFLANIERSKEGDPNSEPSEGVSNIDLQAGLSSLIDESIANSETPEDAELDEVVDALTEGGELDENGVQ
jgi:hypothetical protein